jgi:hypothetical protein
MHQRSAEQCGAGAINGDVINPTIVAGVQK